MPCWQRRRVASAAAAWLPSHALLLMRLYRTCQPCMQHMRMPLPLLFCPSPNFPPPPLNAFCQDYFIDLNNPTKGVLQKLGELFQG